MCVGDRVIVLINVGLVPIGECGRVIEKVWDHKGNEYIYKVYFYQTVMPNNKLWFHSCELHLI